MKECLAWLMATTYQLKVSSIGIDMIVNPGHSYRALNRSAFVRSKFKELCRGCDCERAVERFHSRNPRLVSLIVTRRSSLASIDF